MLLLAALTLLLLPLPASGALPPPLLVRVSTFADLARAVRTPHPSAGGGEVHVVVDGNLYVDATLVIAANAALTVRADTSSSSSRRKVIAAAANFTGGLFTVPPSANLTLQDLEFTGFTCSDGAAVVVNEGNLTAERCAFSANTYSGVQGKAGAAAVYIPSLVATVGIASFSHCEFNGNSVLFDYNAGAIGSYGVVFVTDCVFNNNTGLSGSSIMNIKRSSFAGNHASGGNAEDTGGVISMEWLEVGVAPGSARIHNCNFYSLRGPLADGNTGAFGGCLGVNRMTAEVRLCNFTGCRADRGAVFHSSVNASLVMEDCNFRDNHAVRVSGVMRTSLNSIMRDRLLCEYRTYYVDQ
eukprot:jgi/Chlat1/5271/Chrsp336S04995